MSHSKPAQNAPPLKDGSTKWLYMAEGSILGTVVAGAAKCLYPAAMVASASATLATGGAAGAVVGLVVGLQAERAHNEEVRLYHDTLIERLEKLERRRPPQARRDDRYDNDPGGDGSGSDDDFDDSSSALGLPVHEDQRDSPCCICLNEDNEIRNAFVPCGHLCVCDPCFASGRLRACPLCRQTIQSLQRVIRP